MGRLSHELVEPDREVLRDINHSILASLSLLDDDPILIYLLSSQVRELTPSEPSIDECIEYEPISLREDSRPPPIDLVVYSEDILAR